MIKKDDFLKWYFSIYDIDGWPLIKWSMLVPNIDNHIPVGIILYSLAMRKQLKF